jgi:hypothetical protein
MLENVAGVGQGLLQFVQQAQFHSGLVGCDVYLIFRCNSVLGQKSKRVTNSRQEKKKAL